MVFVWFVIVSLWLNGCADESPTPRKTRTPLHPARSEQPKGGEDSLAALRHEIAALKRTQVQLGRSLQALETELAQARATRDQAATNCPTLAEMITTEGMYNGAVTEEDQFSPVMDELDQQFAQEPKDPRWSQQAEVAIASVLQSVEGAQLLGVDCRATRCQLELLHTDSEAQQQWLAHFPQESPFDGERIIRELHDDPEAPRTVVYLARADHSLLLNP